MLTTIEFINIIKPKHDRTSCDDNFLNNGFFTRRSENWHGRCTRCMYLQIANGIELPEGFIADDCVG